MNWRFLMHEWIKCRRYDRIYGNFLSRSTSTPARDEKGIENGKKPHTHTLSLKNSAAFNAYSPSKIFCVPSLLGDMGTPFSRESKYEIKGSKSLPTTFQYLFFALL